MANINSLNNTEIYLVDQTNSGNSNNLKLFTNIVKYFQKKRNVDFSYANGPSTLHHQITMRENLDLDALPTSISLNDKLKTKEIISSISNIHLKKLITRICPLERYPSQLTDEELKLTSIVKAILSKTQFILLDLPEKHLSQSNINLLKKCLLFETGKRDRTVLMTTENENHWIDIINKVIKQTVQKKFQVTMNLLYTNDQVDNVIDLKTHRNLITSKFIHKKIA
jgi:ABC-type lipoprotein export system ATPase subunit